MQGVDARRIEGVGHHAAHRTHVHAAVGAAGTVAGGEPQPCRKTVVLGGVGVHHQHLRVGAVRLDGKGQRILDLCRNVRCALPGVVFYAARPAGDVLFAAALRILLFNDLPRVCRTGILPQQGHKIVLDAARQRLHGLRQGRGGPLRYGLRLCLLLHRGCRFSCGLPAQPEKGLGHGQRCRDGRCQPQRRAAGKDA